MNKSQNERAFFSNFSQSKNESVSLFEPFYQPKWQISLFFHKWNPYPFTNSYCWSQKKLPLSVGASSYMSLEGVPPPGCTILSAIHSTRHMVLSQVFFPVFFFFSLHFFWNNNRYGRHLEVNLSCDECVPLLPSSFSRISVSLGL